MGRPPLGDRAMTSTERARKHRAKFAKPPSDPQLERARARIVALERELAAARESGKPAAAPTTPTTESNPSLSLTAQQKLEMAIRQHKRQLDGEYVQRRRDEIRKALEDTILPEYNKEREMYRELIKARKGIMTRSEYLKLVKCVHTDVLEPLLRAVDEKDEMPEKTLARVRTIAEGLKPQLEAAFHLLKAKKLRLVGEKEDPTTFPPLPKTYADLVKMRQAASQARAAKRAGAVARRHRS